jgi:hypothetical protein
LAGSADGKLERHDGTGNRIDSGKRYLCTETAGDFVWRKKRVAHAIDGRIHRWKINRNLISKPASGTATVDHASDRSGRFIVWTTQTAITAGRCWFAHRKVCRLRYEWGLGLVKAQSRR